MLTFQREKAQIAVMPMRERIRAAVRRFLGLDDLATKTNLAHVVRMMQTDQRALNDRLEIIENLLQELSRTRSYVPPTRPAPIHIVDWDQAQAIALADLNADPKKEN